MKRSVTLLLAFALFLGCNHDNKKNIPAETKGTKESSAQKEGDTTAAAGKDSGASSYIWSKKEQAKFIEDCKRESDEHVPAGKLTDFCACMLSEAQKYYPTYSQMDKESKENEDRKIFEKCVDHLDIDDE